MARRRRWVLCAILLFAPALPAEAQYFGQNKVQHRTFDFKILKTEHFDFYYYPEEAEAASIVARMAERWHARLSRFFGHDLRGRQTVILYAAPAHFRQTNAIEGMIGEGTGGVTEAMKRRIVLPMAGSLADTDHVLGHELVHAFQFDITGDDPREVDRSLPDVLQFPLWFVEGMAEYLSLGPVDAQTAMWLRDAAIREKLPHIRDLNDPKYFPYRWGHAFWAFIAAKYGDRAVASLIRSAANPRSDLAGLARQLGTDPDTLTSDWHKAIAESTIAMINDQPQLASDPRLTVDRSTGGGRFNVGPRLSPDGKYVVFFSERDLFSVDLYVADVASGRIIERLSQSATDPHFDSLQFLNAAGAWSPDSTRLAIAAVRNGTPVIAFLDPQTGHIRRELPLKGLDDAMNPVYLPDGQSLVLSGNRGGLMDLYRVALDSGALTQLTHDPFGDFEPAVTPDGRTVVFVTERFTTDFATLKPGAMRLAKLDLQTLAVTPVPGFLNGKHLSPQITPDGRTIIFIAEPNGVSNLYKMSIDGGPIEQVSALITGVAGITSSSPALSIASKTGRMAFSVFEADGHAIYTLEPNELVGMVPPAASDRAAVLAGRTSAGGEVQRLLTDYTRGLPPPSETSTATPQTYDEKLGLDFIGQPTLTAGVSSFGGFFYGGASASFSDVLGNRELAVAGQIAGKLADFGGEVVYRNRKHHWNWATAAAVTPYRLGYWTYQRDPATGLVRMSQIIERQISRGGYAQAVYPFNPATRLEVSAGGRSLSFSREFRVETYATNGELVSREDGTEQVAASLHLAETGLALVHDTAFTGATGPLYGARSRFEVRETLGTLQFTGILMDWRRYFMPKRPVTIAIRAFHYGRYGRDEQHPELVDLYAGYPEYLHGYSFDSFTAADCLSSGSRDGECKVFDGLIGSRMLVGNIEARVPLKGLFTGNLEYGRIPVDVGMFYDGAVTWTHDTLPAFAGGTRDFLRSAGLFARGNILGLVIAELAVSRPLDRPGRGWQWQLGIRQGF